MERLATPAKNPQSGEVRRGRAVSRSTGELEPPRAVERGAGAGEVVVPGGATAMPRATLSAWAAISYAMHPAFTSSARREADVLLRAKLHFLTSSSQRAYSFPST